MRILLQSFPERPHPIHEAYIPEGGSAGPAAISPQAVQELQGYGLIVQPFHVRLTYAEIAPKPQAIAAHRDTSGSIHAPDLLFPTFPACPAACKSSAINKKYCEQSRFFHLSSIHLRSSLSLSLTLDSQTIRFWPSLYLAYVALDRCQEED